jgi:hypothetical protein
MNSKLLLIVGLIASTLFVTSYISASFSQKQMESSANADPILDMLRKLVKYDRVLSSRQSHKIAAARNSTCSKEFVKKMLLSKEDG